MSPRLNVRFTPLFLPARLREQKAARAAQQSNSSFSHGTQGENKVLEWCRILAFGNDSALCLHLGSFDEPGVGILQSAWP